MLMSEDPSYESNSCYIQWKAAEEKKLRELWALQVDLESKMLEHEKRRMAEKAREHHKKLTYLMATTKRETKTEKDTVLWKVLGVIAGFIIGSCCFAACLASKQSADNSGLENAINHQTESVPVSTIIPIHPTTFDSSQEPVLSEYNNFVPLLSKDTIQRHDSLPSYEDALKMASVPPEE
ncbi:hypothetical protein Bhyg_17174, partial [Pseudolycoriella hygida]